MNKKNKNLEEKVLEQGFFKSPFISVKQKISDAKSWMVDKAEKGYYSDKKLIRYPSRAVAYYIIGDSINNVQETFIKKINENNSEFNDELLKKEVANLTTKAAVYYGLIGGTIEYGGAMYLGKKFWFQDIAANWLGITCLSALSLYLGANIAQNIYRVMKAQRTGKGGPPYFSMKGAVLIIPEYLYYAGKWVVNKIKKKFR